MTLKTKPKQRPAAKRATSYRPRTTSAPRKRSSRKSSLNLRGAIRTPQTAWLAGGAFAAVVLFVVLAAPLLVSGFEALLRTFGLGLALLAAAVAVDARIALSRPATDQRFMRLMAGGHVLGLFAFGAAALFKPEWEVGDVLFREVSAGGNFGRLLLGSPLAVLGWLAAGFGGLGLVWPKSARAAWSLACAGGRLVKSMNIPQNAWEGIRAFFTSLLPKSEEGNDRLLEEPYVPQWDEEW
ncbi:MAG TPA: hypothetical protein VFP63_03590, partial [Dehalococcoidia bacterium]|nr:hypothetical protein [Dehalococcoidia bacterium]